MPLSNFSQVLFRNNELLVATTPLLINMPADGFIEQYLNLYPQAKPTCLNTNFEEFQLLQQRYHSKIHCEFTSHYKTKLTHDLVIISFPKSKDELAYTLAMIAPFLSSDAQIIIIGENKSGIKSCEKLTSSFLTYCSKVDSARHCTLFAGKFNNKVKPFILEEWFKMYQITVKDITLNIASLPGVFSQDGLDIGTELLLNNLPDKLEGKVLDFGCGAGIISCFIGKKYPRVSLSLLDVSALALTSAEKTLSLNAISGHVFPSNSLSEVKEKFQHIVSNPPFHQGVKTNYLATETFLQNVKKSMSTKGLLTIVANSFLRYQDIMEKSTGPTKIIKKDKGFTIYQCQLK